MKNTLIGLFIIFSFSLQIKGQDVSEKELIGTWKVLKVQSTLGDHIPDDQKATFELFKTAFLKSKFYFLEDKNFSFDFEFEEMQIKKAHWKYNSKTNSIIIQEWADKDSDKAILMEFTIKKEGEKIVFIILEAFTSLEMKKE